MMFWLRPWGKHRTAWHCWRADRCAEDCCSWSGIVGGSGAFDRMCSGLQWHFYALFYAFLHFCLWKSLEFVATASPCQTWQNYKLSKNHFNNRWHSLVWGNVTWQPLLVFLRVRYENGKKSRGPQQVVSESYTVVQESVQDGTGIYQARAHNFHYYTDGKPHVQS